MGNFKEDIARVEAFVFDVDGVMTDGSIIPTPDGDFIRLYYAKDGYAFADDVKQMVDAYVKMYENIWKVVVETENTRYLAGK